MAKIIARMIARPESVALVREALIELAAATRQVPGCASYELYQRDDEPAVFVSIEEWQDGSAPDANMSSPAVAALIARAAPNLLRRPEIQSYTQVG